MAESNGDIELDESFEHIHYPPTCHMVQDYKAEGGITRNAPMDGEAFLGLMDSDGRIINEHALRKAVFKGGISSGIRAEVWRFLFGLYPFSSTRRERDVLITEYRLKYEALKHRWKTKLSHQIGDDDGCKYIDKDYRTDEERAAASHSLPSASERVESGGQAQEQITFFELQAQVYAGRQKIMTDDLTSYIRVIDKDVPRTDRDHEYFRGNSNPNLSSLRHILITFAAYHGEVNYAQGMNDIASRFLLVLESEVDAYWCFNNFIEAIADEFTERGMAEKLVLLQKLLESMDSYLYKYLVHCHVGDLMFCHRWLLLSFKREFSHGEGLRMFEILFSHHLEVNSSTAERQMSAERKREFERYGGKTRTADLCVSPEYTFDLFVCVAILIEHREEIFSCDDPATIFLCINSFTKKFGVDDIIIKAEALFNTYCHKAVLDCFEMVEPPSPTPRHHHQALIELS